MTDLRTAPNAGRFEVRATADSHFGWIRTRLSVERTMMSWLRTAVALIGFGFAIVQYFNHLQQIPGVRSAYLPTAPEYLGLGLISCGVLALVVSIWQSWWTVRYLWGGTFAPIAGMTKERMQSPVLAIAILLSASASSPSLPCCCASHSRPGKQPSPKSTFRITGPKRGD